MPPKAAPAYKKTARKDGKGRIVWTSVKTGEDRVRCKSNAGTMAWRKPVAAAASQAGGGGFRSFTELFKDPDPNQFRYLKFRISTMLLNDNNPKQDRALLKIIGAKFFDPRIDDDKRCKPLMDFLEKHCENEIRELIATAIPPTPEAATPHGPPQHEQRERDAWEQRKAEASAAADK